MLRLETKAISCENRGMEDLRTQLDELQTRLEAVRKSLDLENKHTILRELEAQSLKSDFWQDQNSAKRVMRQIASLQSEIADVGEIGAKIRDVHSVLGEESLRADVEMTITEITSKLNKLETATFLSGKYDQGDAILSVHSGQGGTEAMDWAQMLQRMYIRFAERRGWAVETIEETPGEEAGIKSATLMVSGSYALGGASSFAYGYLKREAGTHRLVRQSPFNADKLRQTSFALVEVLPQIEEAGDIEIKDDDLDVQFFHASGHGGQNVQKVSTAVRLTHKPTGIVVTAQTERFQEQNRKIALGLLRAKLWAKKEEDEQQEKQTLKGEYHTASWGTQIRSYVLHPYQMVKDLRTQVETSDTEGVLDGHLDEFVETELRVL